MRQRAILQVAGPPGAGKTRFLEHLLGGMEESILCIRGRKDDSIRRPEETEPQDHPELRRYREAGATGAALYRFPSSKRDPGAFFDSRLLEDWSEAVVIEGDTPVPHMDLVVFLAPPLSAEASLFRRISRDRAAGHASTLAAWDRAMGKPEDLASLLGGLFERAGMETVLSKPKVLDSVWTEVSLNRARARAAPSPSPTDHWALTSGYEGIEKAGLVVVPARGEEDRLRGKALLEEFGRLRKDPAIFKDVMGPLGSRVPITALVADLSDPKDPGLRKALARVKRTIRKERW